MFVSEHFVANITGYRQFYDMEVTFGGFLAKDAKTYFSLKSITRKNRNDTNYRKGVTEYYGNAFSEYFLGNTNTEDFLANKIILELARKYYSNMTNLEFLFSLLWASAPAFSCFSETEYLLLKECIWKGIKISCGSIF